MTTLPIGYSISPSPLPRPSRIVGRSRITSHYSLLIVLPLALACFALSSIAQAAPPPGRGGPDGDLGNGNTAEGNGALLSLTTGTNNTADGYQALFNNTSGSFNSSTGYQALYSNTVGINNTADGYQALFNNTSGSFNSSTGHQALYRNSAGYDNVANGFKALYSTTTGFENTANGDYALYSNTTGEDNTANGFQALYNSIAGLGNIAVGQHALGNSTSGDANIAVGSFAGFNIITGSSNIDIGNQGVAGDDMTIRIGDSTNQIATFIAGIYGATVTGTAVVVNSDGQLGTLPSSARFKQNIQAMGKSSDVLLSLRPVTFRYKQEIDPKRIPQFGLVAEEVAKVDPDLVARDARGEPYTVRYEAVNAMLLNEFLKEHRQVREQEAAITRLNSTVAKQEATIAQQQKGMEVLTASLKEQAAQIQKVSAEVEVSKAAPQLVDNNQ